VLGVVPAQVMLISLVDLPEAAQNSIASDCLEEALGLSKSNIQFGIMQAHVDPVQVRKASNPASDSTSYLRIVDDSSITIIMERLAPRKIGAFLDSGSVNHTLFCFHCTILSTNSTAITV
jgi:hypothetical protein